MQIKFEEYTTLMKRLDNYEKEEKQVLQLLDTAQSMIRGAEQRNCDYLFDTKRIYEQYTGE